MEQSILQEELCPEKTIKYIVKRAKQRMQMSKHLVTKGQVMAYHMMFNSEIVDWLKMKNQFNLTYIASCVCREPEINKYKHTHVLFTDESMRPSAYRQWIYRKYKTNRGDFKIVPIYCPSRFLGIYQYFGCSHGAGSRIRSHGKSIHTNRHLPIQYYHKRRKGSCKSQILDLLVKYKINCQCGDCTSFQQKLSGESYQSKRIWCNKEEESENYRLIEQIIYYTSALLGEYLYYQDNDVLECVDKFTNYARRNFRNVEHVYGRISSEIYRLFAEKEVADTIHQQIKEEFSRVFNGSIYWQTSDKNTDEFLAI